MSKSAPKHFFSKLASVQTPRSRFDMDSTLTTTISTDYLYPIKVWEVLPGDSWNLNTSNFVRFVAPIDTPMMDNLYMDVHFWYCQNLLVWKHLKQFFGEPDRNDPEGTEYTVPQVEILTEDVSDLSMSIYDFMDIPIGDVNLTQGFTVNALPLRMYNLIYDEWYRDEQRCDYSYYTNGDETVDSKNYKLLKRGKRFDYFTSSLLEPQIGDAVTLPLGSVAPVIGNGQAMGIDVMTNNGVQTLGLGTRYDSSSNGWKSQFSSIGTPVDTNIGERYDSTIAPATSTSGYPPYAAGLTTNPELSNVYADLSQASASTVGDLRFAFQLQALNEIKARNGERYTEYLYGVYGVISPDSRLYRPEYLGGTHQRLTVQPVLQNSETANTPQGNLTGIVYGADFGTGFVRSFTEHGFIIAIANIYSDLTYYQGLDRMWTRQTELDYAIPVLANLTDQPLYRKELLLTGDADQDNEVFGYVERYAEYKYSKNSLTGKCRPNAPLTLGNWTLAQTFDNTLANTKEFIESTTPVERISAVKLDDNSKQTDFICNFKFTGNVVRCLPAYSDPMKWFMRG